MLTNSQAYLKFCGARFKTAPANNHASPTGVLPFLSPASSHPFALSSRPIPSNKIMKWVTSQSSVTETTLTMRYEAYTSLIDHRVRNAWLFTLYLDKANSEAVARQLYIGVASSNPLVRGTLYYQLQQAARTELLKSRTYISEKELYLDAEQAFLSLSTLLSDDAYFFGCDKPTLFDASVFAYTHLLLDESMNWQNTTLPDSLRKSDNLVQHRQRLLKSYFEEECGADEAGCS